MNMIFFAFFLSTQVKFPKAFIFTIIVVINSGNFAPSCLPGHKSVLQASDWVAFLLPPGQSLNCPLLQLLVLKRVPELHDLEQGCQEFQRSQTVEEKIIRTSYFNVSRKQNNLKINN